MHRRSVPQHFDHVRAGCDSYQCQRCHQRTLHYFVQGTDISCTGPLLKSQSDSRAGSRKINVLQHTLNNTEPVELLGCDVDSQCAGEGFSCPDSSCLQGSIAIAGAEPEDRCRQGKTDPPAARLTTEPSAISWVTDSMVPNRVILRARYKSDVPDESAGTLLRDRLHRVLYLRGSYSSWFQQRRHTDHGDFQLHGAIISHVTILSVLSVECRTDATGCS